MSQLKRLELCGVIYFMTRAVYRYVTLTMPTQAFHNDPESSTGFLIGSLSGFTIGAIVFITGFRASDAIAIKNSAAAASSSIIASSVLIFGADFSYEVADFWSVCHQL